MLQQRIGQVFGTIGSQLVMAEANCVHGGVEVQSCAHVLGTLLTKLVVVEVNGVQGAVVAEQMGNVFGTLHTKGAGAEVDCGDSLVTAQENFDHVLGPLVTQVAADQVDSVHSVIVP